MSNPAQKTILLVEDDVSILRLEERMLKSFGYDVVLAKSGEEAVQIAIGNDKIDLILMDIGLGSGMDGTAAARQILLKRNLPIVFLSAHTEKEYVERIKGIAGYGYIVKNSGDIVLHSSIEMAFDLFKAQEAIRKSKQSHRRLKAAVLFMAVLAAGTLFAWWTVQRADLEMRSDLLQQTRMVAQTIDAERIQELTGTEADLNSEHYVRIKEQLAAVRLTNLQCRFLCLMGRKVDGAVFFFVDSERVDSKDYSPPGQVYDKAPKDYSSVFDTKAETVVGPATDRRGTWVSGLVPIYDPQTGALLAVLGMDIAANNWNWKVITRTLPSLGLILVILMAVTVALLFRP